MPRLLILFAVLLGLSGCSTHSGKRAWVPGKIEPGATRMSQPEVVAAAQQFATQRGFSLSDYDRPRLSFTQADHTWGLWFWGRQNTPGDYVLILVDDETGRAQLVPSR